MNSRAKGLSYVREVKKILQDIGYVVEGPGYGVCFFAGRTIPIHRDYFGIFDLLSISKTQTIRGHQVCSKKNKSRNVKKIQAEGLSGYLWLREKGRYLQYWVSPDSVEYIQEIWIKK